MLYNGFVQDRGWGHSKDGGLDTRLAYHLVLGPLFWECSHHGALPLTKCMFK